MNGKSLARQRAGWGKCWLAAVGLLSTVLALQAGVAHAAASASSVGVASAIGLAPDQLRPSVSEATSDPKATFATATLPAGSSIPWTIEFLCYGGLSGEITDVITDMGSSVNPSGLGVTINNVPTTATTYVPFTVTVTAASSTPPGTYGIGVFGYGEPANASSCGANGYYITSATVTVVAGSKINLGCPECPAGNQKAVGDPINVAVGNLYEYQQDFRSPIGSLPLQIARSYNSASGVVGLFGNNWASNLDVRLFGDAGSVITARLADGQEITFAISGSTWLPQSSVPATLTPNSQGYLLERTDTNDRYQFDSTGRLMQQTNVRGETLTLTRNSRDPAKISTVTDSFGNVMSLTWFKYGGRSNPIYLVKTVKVMGKTYAYSYDTTFYNLESVSYTLNGQSVVRRYAYAHPTDPNQLTAIIDEDGRPIANFGYDANTLPNHSDSAGAEGVDIDYSNLFSASPSVVVTNANGYEQEYHVVTGDDGLANIERIIGRVSGNNNVEPATTYTLNNDQNLPAIVVDGNGYGTQYQYDPVRAILTQETRGYQWNGNLPITAADLDATATMSRMQVTQLHPDFPEPTQIVYSATDAQGVWSDTLRIDATYDADNGRLTRWVETDLTQYTTPYASQGQTRSWNYAYTYHDSAKTRLQTETITGPRYPAVNDVTTLQYDSAGRLTQRTDGSGHSWTYSSFTASGMPQRIGDNQNGSTTEIAYDEQDRPLSVTVASATSAAAQSELSYYPNGWLQQTTRPDGSFLRYEYDGAGHLIEVTDSAGNATTLTPNLLDGQWTSLSVTGSSGDTVQTATRAFDDIGRLLQLFGSTGAERLRYRYDRNGQIENSFEDGDIATELTRIYDSLGRLQQTQRQPIGGGALTQHTATAYGPTGAVAAVTDPRGLSTVYRYDGLGNLMLQQSPDSGTTQFWYDAAGNMTQRRDQKNQTLTYSYDAINRLTQIVHSDSASVQASYRYDQTDAAHSYGYGRLTSVSDLSGTTDFAYDAAGRLLQKSQVSGGTKLLTRYSYYAGTDNVQTVTLPSGNVLTYSWNGNAEITDITLTRAGGGASQPLVSAVSYQPFGGPLSWTLGNGTVDRRNYDGDGAVSADPLETDIRYAPNKTRIESMTLGGTANTVYGGVRSFAYDNYAHLTELSGSIAINAGSPTALDLRYGVDAADNRLAQTVAGAATSYTLDPASNRIASTLTGSIATSYYYDANGNLTGSSVAPSYSYDVFNRLTDYNGSPGASYLYNGFDQRVAKTVSGTTTQFVYDEAGHLLGEYVNGTAVQETAWLGDMPVAVITPGATYAVHADYRNTPRQIDNQNGQAVWAWDALAFGDNAAHQDPSGLGSFVYNLRFPGQYADAETGLFYNMARTYDPKLGRYLQSDPIGLAGGVNTYAYVGGNPVSYADPDGRQRIIPLIPEIVRPLPEIIKPGEIVDPVVNPDVEPAQPENCPDEDECNRLNREVQHAKDAVGRLGSCRAGMSKSELTIRYNAWLSLASARAKRDMKCWNGGDEGHQQAQADAWTNVGSCGRLLQ